MNKINENFIKDNDFKVIIDNTPLVSVDLIVKYDNKILLGKRVNRPAKNSWFTLGGRVLKSETIQNAIKRIAKDELSVNLESKPYFIGVFEHLYDDSIFEKTSTHYVNLAYEVTIKNSIDFPTEQHSEYKWFLIEELMHSNEVHTYVKDYFTEELGTIIQERRKV